MSKSRSSFWGTIDEIPDIGVDNFTVYNKKAYFLSHFHTDHTEGLSSAFFLKNLKQTNARIYMSEVTKVIAEYEHRGSSTGGFLEYITPLKLESSLVTLPGEDEDDDEYLQVKLIPAGHCLGSVMFLFRYKEKTILYTGDFRIKQDNLPYYGQLHEKNEPIKIDAMYVDTTFQDEYHYHFPSRRDSVNSILELIRNWLKGEGNRVALSANTNYAYEFVFNEIFKQLGLKVYVDESKWRLYKQLPDQVMGVTNDRREMKIHLCSKRGSENHTACLPRAPPANYLKIYLSALIWELDHEDEPYVEEGVNNNHKVCFSTHCSRNELLYFVNYFSPSRVIGFRNDFKR